MIQMRQSGDVLIAKYLLLTVFMEDGDQIMKVQ